MGIPKVKLFTLEEISKNTGVKLPCLNSRFKSRGLKGKVITIRNTRYFTKEQADLLSVKKITLYRVIKKPKKPYFEFASITVEPNVRT